MNERIFKALMTRMANKSRPFWSLASAVNVYISEKDNYNGEPAVTFGNNVIIYNDFAKMDWDARETYFVHLILHWVKRHSVRNNNLEGMYSLRTKADKETMKKLLNFVEDCQIGWLMKTKYPHADKRYDLFKQINIDIDWDAESLERIIHRLLESDDRGRAVAMVKQNSQINVISTNDAKDEGMDGELGDMDKVQEGQIEKRIKNAKKNGADMDDPHQQEQMIQDHVRTMLLASKQAGKGQDDIFAKLLGELEPPEVPWYRIIINSLRGYVKSFQDSTWSRPSRRGDDYMGSMWYSKPKAFVFVDTSGSIGNEEFLRFISETNALLPHVSGIEYILWDDGIVKNGRKKYKRGDKIDLIRSSGGTDFAPVVDEIIKEVRNGDIIINMTDGIWGDCKPQMDMLGQKHTKRILVTTQDERYGFDQVFHVTPIKDSKIEIEETYENDDE
jgi:hypothetical protein